jgi:peptide methionine sulfoxide reductase msrA/msrB
MNSKHLQQALFASGCFWGTQYHFAKAAGVAKTAVGFAGGKVAHPSYEAVCEGDTGHLECVLVEFDPEIISYENLVRLFFETHDFSQTNGQGPDIGSQYLSAIFVANSDQRAVAEQVIEELRARELVVVTAVRDWSTFYSAEEYHQSYYERRRGTPYCHIRRKLF